MTTGMTELELGSSTDSVPRARRAVRDLLADAGEQLRDDAALVVTELVTNALLHGLGPVHVRLLRLPGRVRLEVEDVGPHLPVRAVHSTEAMTGRGLALVSRLADGWGCDPGARGGKVVWAEVVEDTGGGTPADALGRGEDEHVDLGRLLAAFPDDDPPETTFQVDLGSVPTAVLLHAKSATDNLVREFQLIDAEPAGSTSAQAGVPAEVAELVQSVVHDFAVVRGALAREALAADERGEREVRLVLALPVSAADAGERYLAALDEADRYARNARLLSLETTPVHRVFRRWCVQTVIDQLRAAEAGAPAPLALTFAEALGQAYAAIAPLQAQTTRLLALQRVTAELTAAVSVDDIAQTVVRNTAQVLGGVSSSVHLVDGEVLRSAARYGTAVAGADERYEVLDITPDMPAGLVLLTGRPITVHDQADLAARFPKLAQEDLGDRGFLIAPLIIGGERLGVLSVTVASSARLDEQTQLAFLTTLADVTAQALQRARASSAAEVANVRLRFLAEASLLLSGTLEPKTVLEELTRLVVPRLADWCSLSLLDDGLLTPVAIAHTDPEKVRWARRLSELYPVDMEAGTGAAHVLRTGVSELYPAIPEELLVLAAQDEQHLELIRELGMASALTVPVTGRAGTLGVLTMVMAESGRHYDQSDQAMAEDLARRAAVAVENALDYRAQSGRLASVTRVAEAAQHAILSEPPARLGPVNLAARYVSAASDALVGGDLYEVVRRPGAVRLLVGDVRGKGLEAVRTATIALGEFRSAAADLADLVDVAVQIDRRLRDYLQPEDFVTGVLVELGDDGSWSLVCCGHPPPLVVNALGVTTADVVPTLPLGLGATPVATHGDLVAGDRLVLYTDGVLEARDPARHFVDLAALLAPLGTGPLGEALDAVLSDLRVFVTDALADDLALLVAEYSPHGSA